MDIREAYVIKSIKPNKIIKDKSKCSTTVKWGDGHYTTVIRSKDDQDDDYAAFCAALAIKVFGSNSAVKKTIKDLLTVDDTIKVGDLVHITAPGALYTTYSDWAIKYLDKESCAMYAYGSSDIDTYKTYRVIKVAGHGYIKDYMLYAITSTEPFDNNIFIIGERGIEKYEGSEQN